MIDSAAECAEPRSAAGDGTTVTTVRIGGSGTGWSSAVIAFASRFETWKNLGRSVPRFSGVRLFDSSTMLVKESRPSRSGSMTSGNFWMSSAAILR